ncbi:sulfoacetaldehyde acetyltransferase [Leucobacter sp. M11]|uniref:sulfoacetaldehyde acetyltransferase n=1 Tax=Leucobacter sp. M11 TaxID=2993565 RepID=UPI002D8106B9|nr:sulfoacetaldehyde acetyltransferase [Leucobacter sp. M11]MEB4614757.1 sulfoacetaldehyde acetyltransferase [Leucobacter sp. M11]
MTKLTQTREAVTGPQKMTPSEAFVETLVANDVETVFGIMGSAFMDAMDIFEPAGIRLISVVHEQGAAHMADGFARASGRHGVVIGQNGPGISNCVTGIAAAFWAHSPVVIVTPEAGTTGIGLGGFQEANQLPMFQEFTKYQGHVTHPSRMAEFTGRCFDRAMSESGPTQLNIPRDYFYGEIVAEIPQPRRIDRGAGGADALEEAVALIRQATAPVIVSGGGVVMADGVDACVALAERLTSPVVNSYQHNDSFPASHPLWAGPLGYQGSKAGMELLSQADVVIALGTRLGPFGTLPQYGQEYWPVNAKVIQIDSDHRQLGLVKKISVGICGDARAVAEELLRRLGDTELAGDAGAAERGERIKTVKADWERELSEWTHERDDYSLDVIEEAEAQGGLLHPRQVLRELELALPEGVMLSTDIGNINAIAHSYLRFEQPRSFFAPMSFGNCGYALPTIIGAKAAAPERPAVAYAGDGAWAMSMGEVLTAVRHELPVTAVVFRNRQWGAEKKNQVDFYGRRFVAGELDGDESFAEIARSMGAAGVVVDRLEDVGPALTAAIEEQMAHGVTTVIEVMCTQELGDPFRRDALSKPVRFLEKYRDYV